MASRRRYHHIRYMEITAQGRGRPPLVKPKRGYQITLWHKGKRLPRRWFGVTTYGSKAAALKAAVAVRDQMMREVGIS